MLDNWSGMDMKKAIDYIRRSMVSVRKMFLFVTDILLDFQLFFLTMAKKSLPKRYYSNFFIFSSCSIELRITKYIEFLHLYFH